MSSVLKQLSRMAIGNISKSSWLLFPSYTLCCRMSREFHCERRKMIWKKKAEDREEKQLTIRNENFEKLPVKDKETFDRMIRIFEHENTNRRGVIEFIYAALKHLEEFGVNKNLDTYKKLMDLFPKGKLIPKNAIQREFRHYPQHIDCAIEILHTMECNKVIPDDELYDIVINTFGRWNHPYRKIGRMLYWMPKMKNASPYPLPFVLPNDSLEIAKLALKRMSKVDLQFKLSIFQTEDLKDSIDHTWIVSSQSPTQRRLIDEHKSPKPVYVEGPFLIWIRNVSINYFVLRADNKPVLPQMTKEQYDDISNFSLWMFGEEKKPTDLIVRPSVHEQSDGVFLAMCATGTSSRDSLLSWIRFLQITNPRLSNDIPVLFTLKSPTTEIAPINENKTHDYEENVKSLDGGNEKLIDSKSSAS